MTAAYFDGTPTSFSTSWMTWSTLATVQATAAAPMRLVTTLGDPQAPRMRLWLTAAGPVQFEVDAYDGHQRLKATVSAVAPAFAALLLPLPGGTPELPVRVAHESAATRLTVQWPGRRDEIAWNNAGERPTLTAGAR